MKAENYFTRNRRNMSLNLYKQVIEQAAAWRGPKFKVLKLSLYGEPLLNKHFCEMLRIAREADIAERIETTTNAYLLNEEISQKLVKYQLDYLRVSIYSPYQEKHQYITGTTVDISEIHRNLKILKRIKNKAESERPFVAPKMLDSYSPDNDAFKDMYGDVSDELYLDKPHSWIRTKETDFISNHYGEKTSQVKEDLKRKDTKQRACPMAFTTMAVRNNGDVSPCCVDFIGGTNISNVKEKSLSDIWNSKEWSKFQKMQLEFRNHENSSCAKCDFFHNEHYIKDNIDGLEWGKIRRK
jgi:radical SAM protein with 4Fe4S-binding SPASM domain